MGSQVAWQVMDWEVAPIQVRVHVCVCVFVGKSA